MLGNSNPLVNAVVAIGGALVVVAVFYALLDNIAVIIVNIGGGIIVCVLRFLDIAKSIVAVARFFARLVSAQFVLPQGANRIDRTVDVVHVLGGRAERVGFAQHAVGRIPLPPRGALNVCYAVFTWRRGVGTGQYIAGLVVGIRGDITQRIG